MYKILIQANTDSYKYAMKKVEIMEERIVSVDGVSTIETFGTGKYKLAPFETDSIDELKTKYIELLDTYRKEQLNIIDDVNEIVTITVDIPSEIPSV